MDFKTKVPYQRAGIFAFFAYVIFAVSCQEVEKMFPKVSFDKPFEGKNRRLDELLGQRILLKAEKDTFPLAIFSSMNKNWIVNEKEGDTLFNGTVVFFHGLYYFNQQLNDTSYWIYAARVEGNLVRGIGRGWEQIMLVQQRIENGEYSNLVKYIANDHIQLHPVKDLMPSLFESVIAGLPVDTLLSREKMWIVPDSNIWAKKDSLEREIKL